LTGKFSSPKNSATTLLVSAITATLLLSPLLPNPLCPHGDRSDYPIATAVSIIHANLSDTTTLAVRFRRGAGEKRGLDDPGPADREVADPRGRFSGGRPLRLAAPMGFEDR